MIIDDIFTEQVSRFSIGEDFKKALCDKYKDFCFNIMVDLTEFRYDPEKEAIFGTYELGSKEYALQKYFEPRVETYLRDYLLFGVIESVLEDRDLQVFRSSLPDEYTEVDKFYSTVEYERIVPLELVIASDKFTGYRYTPFIDYQVEHLFKLGMLHEIVVVDWKNMDGISPEEQKRRNWGNFKNQTRFIGAKEFFAELFTPDEAEVYDKYLAYAMQKYKEFLGISSIPKLTAPMMFYHRLEEEKVLFEKAHNEIKDYIIIEEDNLRKNPNLTCEVKELLDTYNFCDKFTGLKLYKALVGRSDFAKSFLTSEYLYSQFNKNDRFDYTSIVSGYLKSVEQLLFSVALLVKDRRDKDGRLYKLGGERKKVTVTSDHISQNKISATMGNVIYFFENEYPELVLIPDEKHVKTFFKCLHLYLDECRNESFHKHNNYNWKRVEKIRNNTFLMYILILVGLQLSETEQETKQNLSIVEDDRLERIYYWLRKRHMYSFKVKFDGEDDIYFATRTAERSFPVFDEYGLLNDFELKLRCTKEITSPKSESEYYTISRENIPEKIWHTTYVSSEPIDFSV